MGRPRRSAITESRVTSNEEASGREDLPAWHESGLVEDAVQPSSRRLKTILNIIGIVGLARYSGAPSAAPSVNCGTCGTRSAFTHLETERGLIGLRNAVEVSLIVAQAACTNRHCRGCHFRRFDRQEATV